MPVPEGIDDTSIPFPLIKYLDVMEVLERK